MKIIYSLAIALSFLLLFSCNSEPTQTEERIPSHKVSPEADVTTTTVPDNIDDVTEPEPPAPDSSLTTGRPM
jgi:hypothetical protein